MKYFFVLAVLLLLLAGCTKSLAEVKSEKYLDEKVTVKGVVKNTIKLGGLSGYTLEDDAGDQLPVASESLPQEGVDVRVSGVVKKAPLLGYYLDVDAET